MICIHDTYVVIYSQMVMITEREQERESGGKDIWTFFVLFIYTMCCKFDMIFK
jgi:hypothetical protein